MKVSELLRHCVRGFLTFVCKSHCQVLVYLPQRRGHVAVQEGFAIRGSLGVAWEGFAKFCARK